MNDKTPDSKFIQKQLNDTVIKLCDDKQYEPFYRSTLHDSPMPSIEKLGEVVDLLKEVLFPGFFGNSSLRAETMNYYIGVNIDKVFRILSEQINCGFCFDCNEKPEQKCIKCEEKSKQIALNFITQLPKIRHILSNDVIAAYNGDPASQSYGEIIFCYPCIKALTNFRIAHELLLLGVPIIPRIITEMAHSETGIDIHPGAQIGEYFTIDHGTGVVIGETSVIGKNVKLYQGVTLGAKSFPLDEQGNPIKGIPRHPIVEDNVVIYAEATILGRITIGANSIVGGNMWITENVPAGTVISQKKSRKYTSDYDI
jgi:serine O-acetyltransferase